MKSRSAAMGAAYCEVETLVGAFDSERACGQRWTAADVNEMAALNASKAGRSAPRKLSEPDLARVRALRWQLFEKWRGVAPGEALGLEFMV